MATIGLVSWGRRGAAVRLAVTAGQLLKERRQPFLLSVASVGDSLGAFDVFTDELSVVAVPNARWQTLVSPVSAKRAATESVHAMTAAGVQRLVILMPHPWDLSLVRQARGAGIEVVQVIHDATRHPGDLWPTRSGIRRRLNDADEVIFLSQDVARLAAHQARRSRIAPHPFVISLPIGQRSRDATDQRVLFVGRFRHYKGLDILLKAWPLVRTPGAKLMVAGDGPLPKLPIPPNVTVIKRWLSDLEIETLIAQADVVVLPYREASQSGIIPLALALGRPVVCTPVGGLQEQYVEGISGLTSASATPQDFASAIDTALDRSWSVSNRASDNEEFVRALLGQ